MTNSRSKAQRFESPEYSAYVSLCRKLALPRFGMTGDAWWYESPDVTGHVRTSTYPDGRIQLTENKSYVSFWLPDLTDWVDALEDLGYTRISFRPVDNPGGPLEGFWMVEEHDTPYPMRDDYDPRDPFQYWGSGATREEAAARLWERVRTVKE